MKQHGFILVVALIFLALLAILSLSVLDNSQLQRYIVSHWTLSNAAFRAAEAGLAAGENKLNTLSYNELPTDYVIKPWESKEYFTIRYNQRDVHYIIDKLQGTNCIARDSKQTEQGAFYRATAWLSVPDQPLLILQTVYARTVGRPCMANQKIIRPGRLSWRELYS